jgi:hypothetical protein
LSERFSFAQRRRTFTVACNRKTSSSVIGSEG